MQNEDVALVALVLTVSSEGATQLTCSLYSSCVVRSRSLSSIFMGLFSRNCMGVFGRSSVAEYFFLSSLAAAVEGEVDAKRAPPTRRRGANREKAKALPPAAEVRSRLMVVMCRPCRGDGRGLGNVLQS